MPKRSCNEKNTSLPSIPYKEHLFSPARPHNRSTIVITGPDGHERTAIEAFVQRVYRDRYNATIQINYPGLISIRNEDGDITAAAGFRYADCSPLFLERYTGVPIEEILHCPRREVAEVGNLAADGRGACLQLFTALANHLHDRGISYTAVTGTVFLHRLFNRLGLEPQVICSAAEDVARDPDQTWGSYYETRPRVLVGSVARGVERLADSPDNNQQNLPLLITDRTNAL